MRSLPFSPDPGILQNTNFKSPKKKAAKQGLFVQVLPRIAANSVPGAAPEKASKAVPEQGLFGQIFPRVAAKAAPGAAPKRAPKTLPEFQADSVAPAVAQSPIQRLKRSIEETGQPAECFELPASNGDLLKEVLVASGYDRDSAQEIIRRASTGEGNTNLGALFAVLPEYIPQEGELFLLNPQDRPLLIQVLRDLGVGESEIQDFVDCLETKEDKLVVAGLPRLLAQAEGKMAQSGEAPMVDQATLKDLLGRLGLEENEIETLLTRATDGKGRTNPRAVLALLQRAAAKQEHGVAKPLRELAAKLQMAPQSVEQPRDAARIHSQVMKNLMGTGKIQHQSADSEPSVPQEAAKPEAGTPGRLAGNLKNSAQGTMATENEDAASERISPRGSQMRGKDDSSRQQDMWGQHQSAKGEGSARAADMGQEQRPLPGYLIRQVSQEMTRMVRANQNTLRLNLKPPELGELSVKLEVRAGVVRAALMAETVAAKTALEQGLDQLKHQLSVQGLKVERLEVVAPPETEQHANQAQAQADARTAGQGPGGGQGPGSRQDPGEGQGTGGGGEGGAEEDVPSAPGRLDYDDGSINLFA